MATGADPSRRNGSYVPVPPSQHASATSSAAPSAPGQQDDEKALPLPGWLLKLYFVFPVILYIPDAIFNYYVYSDGASVPQTDNIFLEISQIALWGFLSVGVVGMAYLLSMLAPWHWMQGHKVQAFFCGIGVVIATAITIWNSLAYRSESFKPFATDQWVYSFWPELAKQQISLTMILAAIAPPFWGLFWAIVQPTQVHKNLAALQESHAERIMRLQQEAELKELRAEANAKIRAAQLKGMAQTAAAAREQAGVVASQWRKKGEGKNGKGSSADAGSGEHGGATPSDSGANMAAAPQRAQPSNILQMPPLSPSRPRDAGTGRSPVMMNSVAPATAATHAAPSNGRSVPAQPALLREADVEGSAGVPPSDVTWSTRRPQGANRPMAADVAEAGEMTGTTGPRPAVRRPAEPSPFLRAMNEPSPAQVQAVNDAFKELGASGKRVAQKDVVALVARKLNINESSARNVISRVRETQRTGAH